MPFFLSPDFVAAAATAIPPARKRRSRPTEVPAIVSDEEENFQPLKKKRSVRLATESIDPIHSH